MAANFPNLEQILLRSGFDKSVTAYALEWLDTSKERDMALLEKLTVQDADIEQKIWQNYSGYYRVAFTKDVIPLGSEELYRRIIIMSYKLLDANAFSITAPLFFAIQDMDAKTFNELKFSAMKEVWGDEAQARSLAVDYAKHAQNMTLSYADLPREPEPYLKAAELTSDMAYIVKLMLCANALEYLPIPEDGKLSDEAQRAVSIIKSIMNGDIANDDQYLLTALAPASFFDEQLKKHFSEYAASKASEVYYNIPRFFERYERTVDAFLSAEGTITQGIIYNLLDPHCQMKELLKSAAKIQTKAFKDLMLRQKSVRVMAKMNDALKAVMPYEALNDEDFKKIAIETTADVTASCFNEEKNKIKAYLKGEISFDEIWPVLKSTKFGYKTVKRCNYIEYFGVDSFIIRCIAVLGGCIGSYSGHLEDVAGYNGYDCNVPDMADKMLAEGVNIVQALDICGNIYDRYGSYSSDREKYIDFFSGHTDDLASANITKCNATAKNMALTLFKNDEKKYRSQIIALAGDSAKSVRETVAEIVVKHPEWSDDVKALLSSKKSVERDMALTIIERQGAKTYISELKAALSAEKTDKLKARIGSVLAVVSDVGDKVSVDDIVKDMTKGKKTAKLDWLFKEPLSPVHKKDGTEADESSLKALMLCFANNVGLKDPNADKIVSELVPDEVCRLANEVLNRWLTTPPEVKSDWVKFFQQDGFDCADTLDAQPKYKWVLYLASVYGGKKALDRFDELMDHWPLMQKGTLAKEIPHAIILNGSSEYIMKVEKMSRTHRFNSIRKASADALLCAAEKLGMNKEEFADLMVPDLNFDENMCRTFDYGSRQFKVYISPKLEPEIYCDGKKIKSMPKPSSGDDMDIAEAAYKEFTAMKKLMKSVVATERVRLENTMRTARSWTYPKWKKLFVANPIMHRFAIGLIWGIYKEDRLEKCFRYLDDGSFTTSCDEELTIPDNAHIGLVHPVELSEDELSAWRQQLKDYDIIQPFSQLDRRIFKPTDEEKNADCIERFKGQVIKCIELAGAMNNLGWSKGKAGDGAIICEFLREDIFARNNGIKASLTNSGLSVEIYRNKEDDVTIEELYFYRLPDAERMSVSELSDRYFSEIMYQLSKVFI